MFSLRFICAGEAYSTFTEMVPAPLFRRTFEVTQTPESASLTICGLGFYELYLNGERLTKGFLAPYISNPDDILYYDAYDLTGRLRLGKNTLGVWLGNGMLNCPGGEIWDFQTARYRHAPMLALSFEAKLAGGGTLAFEADSSFVTAPSPVYYDDLRVGEFYDARREVPGWSLPAFDDSGWTPAMAAPTPRGDCRLCGADPIVAAEERAPVSIRRAAIGKQPHIRPTLPKVEPTGVEAETEGWLYDFGVNDAGLARLKICGRPGQKIVLQFGETLDENGDLDLRGMSFLPRAFNHRDIYICRGEGEEIFLPRFTYHGFRYVLVLGMDEAQATPEALTYVVMHSDLASIGGFSCSDETLNRLQEATRVADLANFYYFPTDCPHREKNGWTADAALSAEQMLLNFTPEKSYREWLSNIRRAQREDGAIPGIIPTSGWGFAWGNGPAWDCIIAYLPYFIWKYRGDLTPARESAGMLMRYLHYLTTRRDADGLIHIGLGDWCHSGREHSAGPKAPLEVTDTFLSIDIARKSERLFAALGMEAQRAFAETVKDEFLAAARRELIDYPTMTVRGGCQSAQVMAIFYDVFTETEKPAAFGALLHFIEERDGLMDVGVLGARVLFRVLSAFGCTDLAYKMITTTRYPSYGYWIAQGATSLWESFWPEGEAPASCNHHFWGDVSGWMIENLAGITVNPHLTNPNTVIVRPRFIEALSHAEGFTAIPAGEVRVSWQRDGDTIRLTVSVPEGCRGQLLLENGWQTEDGLRAQPLKSGVFRLLPGTARDRRANGPQ